MSQLVDSIMLEAIDELDSVDIMDSVSDNMLDSIEGSHCTDISYMDDIDDFEDDEYGYEISEDIMDDPESITDDELIDLVLSGEEDF